MPPADWSLIRLNSRRIPLLRTDGESLEVLHEPAVGDFENPPLLFIHGSYCAAWIWAEYYLPFFGAHGYACYALSLRGHGGSPGDVEWTSLADYVADAALIAAALPRPPVLIGHSLGGLIAQYVAAAGHPAGGLIMLASTPPSGLASSNLHMMVHAPEVLFQLGMLQAIGPAGMSMRVLHRALFSVHMPRSAGR